MHGLENDEEERGTSSEQNELLEKQEKRFVVVELEMT